MAAVAFRRIVSVKLASNVSLVLLVLLAVFHLLVLAGVIPYNVVWGGRLESAGQMVAYELAALLIVATFILSVLWRAGYIGNEDSPGPRRFMWLPSVFFLSSVGGNLAASSDIERAVFTPVALILALLSLRLVLKD